MGLIIYHCPNSNSDFNKQPLKLEYEWIITSHTNQWMKLLSHVLIYFKPCQKKATLEKIAAHQCYHFNSVPAVMCAAIYAWRRTITVLRVFIIYLKHTGTKSPRDNAYWKFTCDSDANANMNLNSREQTELRCPYHMKGFLLIIHRLKCTQQYYVDYHFCHVVNRFIDCPLGSCL